MENLKAKLARLQKSPIQEKLNRLKLTRKTNIIEDVISKQINNVLADIESVKMKYPNILESFTSQGFDSKKINHVFLTLYNYENRKTIYNQ